MGRDTSCLKLSWLYVSTDLLQQLELVFQPSLFTLSAPCIFTVNQLYKPGLYGHTPKL